MPEVITKYPAVALKILKDAGAKCNVGAKQQILTSCPKDQFCALPTGEICVYGINHIASMTQVSVVELAEITGDVPTLFSPWNTILLGVACLFGIFFGMLLKRK